MKLEQLPYRPEQYVDEMARIMKLPPHRSGYNNYLLQGEDRPTMIHTFSALYPYAQGGRNLGFFYTTFDTLGLSKEESQAHAAAIRAKIAGLTIPERVRKISLPDNQVLLTVATMNCFQSGIKPLLFITFGEAAQGDRGEMITIWQPPCLSVQSALGKMKEHVIRRTSSMN